MRIKGLRHGGWIEGRSAYSADEVKKIDDLDEKTILYIAFALEKFYLLNFRKNYIIIININTAIRIGR